MEEFYVLLLFQSAPACSWASLYAVSVCLEIGYCELIFLAASHLGFPKAWNAVEILQRFLCFSLVTGDIAHLRPCSTLC